MRRARGVRLCRPRTVRAVDRAALRRILPFAPRSAPAVRDCGRTHRARYCSARAPLGRRSRSPAHCGSYYLWGPTTRPADVAIAYALPRSMLLGLYRDVEVAGRIDHPLAHPKEVNLPIYVCRNPTRPLATAWPKLKRYSHEPTSASYPADLRADDAPTGP